MRIIEKNKIGTLRVRRFQRTTSKSGAACDQTERIFLSAAAYLGKPLAADKSASQFSR